MVCAIKVDVRGLKEEIAALDEEIAAKKEELKSQMARIRDLRQKRELNKALIRKLEERGIESIEILD